MERKTISSLRHHCLSIRSWLSRAMSRTVCSSVVHRMLHVHGEDVPSSLSSYSTWYISSILRREALLGLWGHWQTGELKNIKSGAPVLSIITAGLEPPLSLPAETNDVREKKKEKKKHGKKHIKWQLKLINLTSVIALHDLRSQILCHAMGSVVQNEYTIYIYINIYTYILWLWLLWLFIVHLFCFALFYFTTIISTYGFHCTCKVTFKMTKMLSPVLCRT